MESLEIHIIAKSTYLQQVSEEKKVGFAQNLLSLDGIKIIMKYFVYLITLYLIYL